MYHVIDWLGKRSWKGNTCHYPTHCGQLVTVEETTEVQVNNQRIDPDIVVCPECYRKIHGGPQSSGYVN